MSDKPGKYESFQTKGERGLKKNTYELPHNLNKSYLKLRRAIGYLGILLPISLVIISLINRNGCNTILPSISDYYHTSVGGIFTGILVSIAIFLWYNGENRERLICRITSGLAIVIAFAPTPINENYIITESSLASLDFFRGCYIPKLKGLAITGNLHFISAALFFLLLSYLVGNVFRKQESSDSPEGKRRRVIYLICAWGMLGSLVLLAALKVFFKDTFPNSNDWSLPPTFALETIMLFCFGVAWLVKGEVTFQQIQSIFNDDKD